MVYLHNGIHYPPIKNSEFMKFLSKWMELENIILGEVTQSQKNTHGMYSLISGYLPRNLEFQRYNSQTKGNSRRRKNKVWILWSFLEAGTKYSQEEIQTQSVEQRLRKGHPETAPPTDPSHLQLQNPDTIVDANQVLADRSMI